MYLIVKYKRFSLFSISIIILTFLLCFSALIFHEMLVLYVSMMLFRSVYTLCPVSTVFAQAMTCFPQGDH